VNSVVDSWSCVPGETLLLRTLFSTVKLRDSITGRDKIFLSSAIRLHCLRGHTQPCVKGVPVAIFPGVRQPDCELTTKLHPVQRVGMRGAYLIASKWFSKIRLYRSRFIPAVCHVLLRINKEIVDPCGRAVWGTLLQGSRVRIPLSAWIFISRVCCVGRGLCDQFGHCSGGVLPGMCVSRNLNSEAPYVQICAVAPQKQEIKKFTE
jgi:hypothetical protein